MIARTLRQEATTAVSEQVSRRRDEYQNHTASRLNDCETNAKT